MDKKVVLFISNSGGIGGAQLCLLELIKNLSTKYSPIVLIPKRGKFSDILVENNIDFFIVPFRGWWYSKFRIKLIERAFNNILALIAILYKIRKLNISLIYSNTLYSPIGGIISLILNVPHIWHIHEFTHLNKIQFFDFGLLNSMNFVNRNSQVVICPSNALKEDLSKFITTSNLKCIPNGIDLKLPVNNYITERSDTQFNILIIGSINEFKGQRSSILALSKLHKHGKNVRLSIVGEGSSSEVSDLKKIANKLDVGELILWEGHQDNVFKYLGSSDVLYVCSEFETFSKVILEAMLIKCPVIATNTGGISEIIVDGENGYLYTVGDIDMLVNKTVLLMDNYIIYNKFQNNGFNTCIEKFGLNKYVQSIEALMDKTSI